MLDSTILPPALEIETSDDGGVVLRMPAVHRDRKAEPSEHGANLAERLSEHEQATIADRILEGVKADERSRSDWIGTYNKGLDLLGLKIEDHESTKSQRGNIAKVRDPLLLESIVKAQSLALGELMPADGPAKGRVIGDSTAELEALAADLETDLNAYLTDGAPEYYPDLDRGLFGYFYSGNMFRKPYIHPIYRRPCVDTIDVEDCIVSQDAVDLATAVRVTHRSFPSPAITRRMQIAGHWLDVDLPPATPTLDQAQGKKMEISGLRSFAQRPEDQVYCVLESTTDLDLAEFAMGEEGQPDGLPISYTVTVEETSRRLLAVRRAWREGDAEFIRRVNIVHYGMVPGPGFLCLGYVHLLGNQTKALTAMWRVLCDLGMYACFTGGVKTKGVRLGTNEVAPAPGEWVDVDVAGIDDIRKALMPMPYNFQAAPAFLQLIELIRSDAQRLGAAPELETGEGRSNVPVGTILAMVEQAMQTTTAVHKRLHRAQARELLILKSLIAGNPAVLDRVVVNPQRRWAAEQAFDSVDVVPVSDPNVPSRIHRIMLATAKIQVAGMNPDIYDRVGVHKQAWRDIGVSDMEDKIHASPPGAPPPDPKAATAAITAQVKQAELAQKQQENQRKAANEAVAAQHQQAETVATLQDAAEERASRERIAEMEQQTERMRLVAEAHRANTELQHEAHQADAQRAHEAATTGFEQAHERSIAAADRQHQAEIERTKAKAAANKPKPKSGAKK